jgi:hypothetical protein
VTVIIAPSVACGWDGENSPGISSRYEARKSDLVRNGLEVAWEWPSRADERRAALHTAMGDILKIVRFGAVRIPRGCGGRDRHPVSTMRAGKHETRQVRWGNLLEGMKLSRSGDLPPPSPDRFNRESTNICAAHNICALRKVVPGLAIPCG